MLHCLWEEVYASTKRITHQLDLPLCIGERALYKRRHPFCAAVCPSGGGIGSSHTASHNRTAPEAPVRLKARLMEFDHNFWRGAGEPRVKQEMGA